MNPLLLGSLLGSHLLLELSKVLGGLVVGGSVAGLARAAAVLVNLAGLAHLARVLGLDHVLAVAGQGKRAAGEAGRGKGLLISW